MNSLISSASGRLHGETVSRSEEFRLRKRLKSLIRLWDAGDKGSSDWRKINSMVKVCGTLTDSWSGLHVRDWCVSVSPGAAAEAVQCGERREGLLCCGLIISRVSSTAALRGIH